MGYKQQPSALDLLKVVGLLVIIGVVAFDIFAVRSKNKMLWQSIETQKTEFQLQKMELQSQIKELKEVNADREKDYKRKMEEVNRQIQDAKCKVKDNQTEQAEEITILKESHQKAMEEQKAAYEKRIQDMQADFNSRMNNMRRNASQLSSSQPNVEISPKMVRCKNCSGKGAIQVKKRCQRCGGSGKIKEQHTYNRNLRRSHGTNTRDVDCPSCLPGSFRGGGSKGYTIETETCPKCGGQGKVKID